jgi:hypothetical protein
MEFRSGEFKEESQYTAKTDAEIKDLAMQLFRGEIFTSWMIAAHDINLLPNIFMPLVFIDEITRKEFIRDGIVHFYGLYSEAVNMNINGYPIFYSMGMLNTEDGERVNQKLKQITELMSGI